MIRPVKTLDKHKYVFSDISLTSTNLSDPIPVEIVKSLAITHDYDNAISPFIILTVGIVPSVYQKIIENIDTLRFKMNILKMIVDKDDTMEGQPKNYISLDCKATIKDQITTYTSNVLEFEKSQEIQPYEGIDTQISEMTFFLYDDSAIKKYRQCSSYIINGGMNDIVYRILVDRGFKNILISNSENNKFGEYIVPYGNLGENLEFLNSHYGIYSKNYLFYMDINTIYMINKFDVGSVLSNTEYGAVNIYLENIAKSLEVDGGSYSDSENRLYGLNGIDFLIQDNDSTIYYYDAGKITSAISGTKDVKVDTFSDCDVERAYVFNNANERTQLISKILEDNKIVTVELSEIDLNILTPNKKYNIIIDGDYGKKYDLNGAYRLASQSILFTTIADETVRGSVQINLKKLN